MTEPLRRQPAEDDVARIVRRVTGQEPESIRRFPTGLLHFVYDVALPGGGAIVVRMAPPGMSVTFDGALYWYERLRPLGIPMPDLLHADVDGRRHGVPLLIMERLPGTDLGHVYPSLTVQQKRRIVEEIVEIQRRAGSLPLGRGFGYATSHDDPRLRATWSEVLDAGLAGARRSIRRAGIVDAAVVDRVVAAVDRFRDRLDRLPPTCFLDDTTTKNVIIQDGRLTGIVDVDCVCFGDPVRTPALTRMALLAQGHEADYVEYWKA